MKRGFHVGNGFSMKAVLLMLGLSILTACKGSTEYGECVGFDEADRQSDRIYKVSVRNAIWSFVGIETIIAPVLWATDYVYCPVAKREP